jgi:hypothetical protein
MFTPVVPISKAARAEELRSAHVFALLRRGKQRGNQFRREQIPARLTGNEHEGFWFHGIISTQRRKIAKTQRKSLLFWRLRAFASLR